MYWKRGGFLELYRVTYWCHHFVKNQVKKGDICIDATAGNGHDTLLLCSLVEGSNKDGRDSYMQIEKGFVEKSVGRHNEKNGGKVYSFDIQMKALEATKEKVLASGFSKELILINDGHENIRKHIPASEQGLVSCVMFNFGYLPGGDHNIVTKEKTSIKAIEASLDVLKRGGLVSLCIYSSKEMGHAEKDAILAWLKMLDSQKYLVIVSEYYNRNNDPPIPALVYKL